MNAMKPLKLKERGDTIVEVMVCVAILGAILGGAYTIATRSLRSAQIAHERSEALKLVEGQIERLKYVARNHDEVFDEEYRSETRHFCLTGSDDVEQRINPGTPPNPPGSHHADCSNGIFRLNTTYKIVDHEDPTKLFGTFSVEATWERIGGGQERLIINYQT